MASPSSKSHDLASSNRGVTDNNTPTRFVSQYEVEEEKYFENVVGIWEQNVEENMKLVKEKVDRTKWGMGPATVNAYHSSSKNLIAIPGGILQSPFYNKASPKLVNRLVLNDSELCLYSVITFSLTFVELLNVFPPFFLLL